MKQKRVSDFDTHKSWFKWRCTHSLATRCFLLLILHGLSGLRVEAQSQSAEQEAYAALRAVESKTDRCWAEREAMARQRDNERIRIPSYTAELSKVIYD